MVASLSIKVGLVAEMLDLLRGSLFDCVDEQQATRAQEMTSICVERCDAFTHELEERLRLHWPRKGRTDVKVRFFFFLHMCRKVRIFDYDLGF
jgi:hypothetical protein